MARLGTGYLFIFILKVSPDGISHALVHHTLVIWEALRASLIYWVPVPLPSNIQANEGLVRDPPKLKMSQATWEVTSNLGRGTRDQPKLICPKVGKYRPSLAFGQSDGWEGGMEAEAIDELRKKLRRERF